MSYIEKGCEIFRDKIKEKPIQLCTNELPSAIAKQTWV